jgi:hypothetical protein
MSGIEGLGEAVTGGMFARSVEPAAGEAHLGRHAGACLNCATPLAGNFCHECGQAAHVHRSLGAFFHDLTHAVLHLEGKTWRTLPMLAWKPGELTRRYIDGQRARFVSPMALFLFSVFIMFAVIQGIGASLATPEVSDQMRQEALTELQMELKELRQKRDVLREAKAKEEQAGRPAPAIDAQLEKVADDMRDNRTAVAMASGTGLLTGNSLGFSTGWKRLDKGIQKANENPNLALYKVQTNAYKFSWALIPISVPFVWMMFAWRRRFHLYDHTVFVTYSLAFMTMLGVVLTLAWLAGLPKEWAWALAALVPPYHIYRHLRGTYDLGRLNGLIRTSFLLTFANIAITIFFLLLLALGALG